MASAPESHAWELPGDLSAAAVARRHVEQFVGQAPYLDDAVLVASELVTNAVLHGKPPVTFELTLLAEGVHMTVCDSGSGPASSADSMPDVLTPTGRGRALVARLAREHGSARTSQGWETWAVVG